MKVAFVSRGLSIAGTLLVLVCAGACTRQSRPEESTIAIRDELGHLRGELSNHLDKWTVDSSEAICPTSSEVERLSLDATRGAVLTLDNHLVVGNPGTHQLLLFDSEGQFLRAFGRRGGGPGEFVRVDWVGIRLGEIITYDSGLRRVSGFSPRDGFKWSADMPTAPAGDSAAMAGVAGALNDGRLVLYAHRITPRIAGRFRVPQFVYLWNPESGVIQHVATIAGPERQLEKLGSEDLAILRPLFPRQSFVAAVHNHVVTANSETFTLTTFDVTTGSFEVFSAEWRALPVSRRAVRAELAKIKGDLPELPDDVVSALRGRQTDSIPVLAHVMTDGSGNVWVQPTRHTGGESHPWWVISPSGIPTARVEVPQGINVVHISSSKVVGVTRTDDAVSLPCLYRLSRGHKTANTP